jgi:CBS domain-containing protein
MPAFSMPVSSVMTAPVVTVPETARLYEVDQVLREHDISCVAVIGSGGRPSGVISRTDLLRIGRAARNPGRGALLSLPDQPARAAMQPDIVAVAPEAPVSGAARTMVAHRIHRVFVTDGEALVGVLSTKEVLLAFEQQRAAVPIGAVMSSPVLAVPLHAEVALATDRLEHAHVSGLCVVDEDSSPVGTFTQTEALACRELDGSTPVEEVMSYAMLCLQVRTPISRAAARAHATRARRVLAVEDKRVKGVLTALDFARFAACA